MQPVRVSPDRSNSETADGKPKALAKVYAELVRRLNGRRQVRARATTTLTYSLAGL